MITSSRPAIAQTTTKSTNRYNRLNQTNHFKHNIQQCLTSKANLDTKRMQIYSKQTIGTITPSYHRQQQPKKFKKKTKKWAKNERKNTKHGNRGRSSWGESSRRWRVPCRSDQKQRERERKMVGASAKTLMADVGASKNIYIYLKKTPRCRKGGVVQSFPCL